MTVPGFTASEVLRKDLMGINMTKEQFEREKNYRISQAITKSMLNKGLITDREYKKIDTILKHKYRPVFGSL